MVDRNVAFIVVVIAIIGIVAAQQYGFKIPFTRQSVLDFSGFTVTSIGTTSVISPSTDLTGVFFLVNTVFNGGGQSIAGTITPDQTKQLSGYQTNYPLSIQANSIDQQATFSVANQGQPIYKYSYTIAQCGFLDLLGCFNKCPSGTYSSISSPQAGFTGGWLCVDKKQVGVKGGFNNPTVNFQSQISLTVNGNTLTKTVSNQDQSVNFYDGSILRATAQWTGSLVTGTPLPNINNYVSVWNMVQNYWKAAYSYRYDNYATQLPVVDSWILQKNNNGLSPASSIDLDNQIALVNSPADQLLQADDSLTLNPTAFYTNPSDSSGNSAGLTVKLSSALAQNPNVVFKVRADWLGVVIPTSTPQITSAVCPDFYSGNPGAINVNVQNIGNSPASFVATATCQNIFITSSPTPTTINPQQIVTIVIPLSTAQTTAFTSSCSVTTYDYNNPSAKSTSPVTCNVKTVQQCNPNQQIPSGNCVLVCRADGQGFDDSKKICCTNGLKYDDATKSYQCAGPTTTPPTKDRIPLDLPLIFAAISGILVFLMTGRDALKDRDYVDISISAVIAVIVGVVAWWILSNILAILAGSAILAILGGYALFAFGSIFIAIATTIGIIIKKLKGE